MNTNKLYDFIYKDYAFKEQQSFYNRYDQYNTEYDSYDTKNAYKLVVKPTTSKPVKKIFKKPSKKTMDEKPVVEKSSTNQQASKNSTKKVHWNI